jgi:uncharacterized membrane protein
VTSLLHPEQAAAAASADRKGYLDWLRGVGVLIMIQGHVIDAWTAPAERTRAAYHWISFVGGLAGTPIFLFLAGVALALGAGARMRRGRSAREVAALARRRGWQIFGLAFLFRLQSWVISGGSPWTLLKVDILNVMGVAMIVGAILWGAGRGRWSRGVLLASAAVAAAMVTPLVRAAAWVSLLPDPVEAYLRPAQNMTTFTLLPWAGFVFAGAAAGVWLDRARTARDERLVAIALGLGGLAAALGGYAASLLPPLYAATDFWTSSPTFFFVRLGAVMALVPVAHAWNGMSGRSWLCKFGRSSLFVYWIHVEMAYGVVSMALHRRLPLEQAYLGFILLSALLFGLVKIKEHARTTKVTKVTKDRIEKSFSWSS